MISGQSENLFAGQVIEGHQALTSAIDSASIQVVLSYSSSYPFVVPAYSTVTGDIGRDCRNECLSVVRKTRAPQGRRAQGKANSSISGKYNDCIPDGTTLGNSTYPNFLLNGDVASDVFSFLDIRSLYNVTMTCRIAMRLLRHEHVVRSALMQGGHSKTSMERLMVLIENKCIWIPSPLRMLRLCNGKTCERCFTGRVHLVSEHYGVFFCFRGCIQNFSTRGVAFNVKWAPFLVNQPRVAKCAYNTSAQIWIRPYSDLSGERCGPLVSMIEMERVIRGQGSLERILKEKDMADMYEKSVSEIARVFKDTTEAACERIRERKQKKKQASLDANERRKEKVMDMVEYLANRTG